MYIKPYPREGVEYLPMPTFHGPPRKPTTFKRFFLGWMIVLVLVSYSAILLQGYQSSTALVVLAVLAIGCCHGLVLIIRQASKRHRLRPPRLGETLAVFGGAGLLCYCLVGIVTQSLATQSLVLCAAIGVVVGLIAYPLVLRWYNRETPAPPQKPRKSKDTISGHLKHARQYVRPIPGETTALTILTPTGDVVGTVNGHVYSGRDSLSISKQPGGKIVIVNHDTISPIIVLGHCNQDLEVRGLASLSNVSETTRLTAVA